MQTPSPSARVDFSEIAAMLAETAKALHARGWLLGTSGNLSAIVQREPLLATLKKPGPALAKA